MPSTPTKALTPARVSSQPPSSSSSSSSKSSTSTSSPSRFGLTPTRLSLSPNNNNKIRSSLDERRRGTTRGILVKDCCGARKKNISKDSREREQFWVFVQHAAFFLLATCLVFAMSIQRARINAQLDLEIFLGSVKSSILLRASSAALGAGGGGGGSGSVYCEEYVGQQQQHAHHGVATNSGVVVCHNETTPTLPTTIKSSFASSTPALLRGGGASLSGGSPQEGINHDTTFLKYDFDSVKREERFPSIEDRVKLYMSDWYVVPCQDHHAAAGAAESPMVRYHFVVDEVEYNFDEQALFSKNDDNHGNNNATRSLLVESTDSSGNPTRLQIGSSIESDRLFYLEPSRLPACYQDLNNAARVYCRDVSDTLVPLLETQEDNNNTYTPPPPPPPSPPLLFQFGDKLASRDYGYVQVPHIRKFRRAIQRNVLAEITAPTCHDRASSRARSVSSASFASSTSSLVSDDDTRFQGILWKLNTKRHFGDIVKVQRSDVPWSKKKNMAIFWGGPNQPDQDDSYNNNNSTAALTDSEKCHAMPRCRFVLMYANSTLVEAKLSKTRDIFANNVIDGVAVTAPQGRKSVSEVIKYKGIIMLEGNDVASGLKWSLYSNSVVLMPPPTFTSFAMEELLVPFVHYVPLRSDLSDAQEQMQWILDNDVQAQKIAQTGKQWVHDLLFHQDAARDNELVNREILKRYRMHFEQDTLS